MYKCPIKSDNSGTSQLYDFLVQLTCFAHACREADDTTIDTTHVMCTVYNGFRYLVNIEKR